MADNDIVLDFMVVEEKVIKGKAVVVVEKLLLENCESLCVLLKFFKVVRCSCEIDESSLNFVAVEVHNSFIEVISILLDEIAELSFGFFLSIFHLL